MSKVVPNEDRNRPIFLEDYTILVTDTSEKIRIKGISGNFSDWIFEINGIKINENEKNDEATLVIDYDLIDHTLSENPSTDNPEIMTFVGDCILDLIDKAIKEQKFNIENREENFEHREPNTQSTSD